MFITLSSPIEIILVVVGLLVFALVAWRKIDLAAALILLLAPLYLFKVVILGLPGTLLELLILVLALVWLVKRVINKSGPSWKALDKNLLWPAGLIIIGTFLATAWSVDWKISAGIFKSWILEPILLAFIIWDIIKTREQFKKMLLAVVASGAMVAVFSLIYWLAGELTFDGRLKGFYLSPNHLAMYLAPGLILLAGLFILSKNKPSFANALEDKREKIILGVLGLAMIAALYLTYSYAAWFATLAALVFLALALRCGRNEASRPAFAGRGSQAEFFRSNKPSSANATEGFSSPSSPQQAAGYSAKENKKRWLAVILLIMIVLIAAQWSSVKFHNLIDSDRSSWQSRLMVWRAATTIAKDHWLVGVGPGLFQQYYLEYQQYFSVPYLEWAVPQPHNLWLAWWLQGGLAGLIGFCWLMIIFFWQVIKSFKKPSRTPMIILAAAMVCILVHGLVDTPYWKNDLALVFWLLIALSDKAGRLSY